MLYYRANAEKHDYSTGYTTIIGELLTQRERDSKFRYLSDDVFDVVEVSRKRTFTMFGCRFEKATVNSIYPGD